MFDVVRPEARGTAAGFMNMVGWLGGGGTAPLMVGWLGDRYGLGFAISMAAAVYVAAGILLIVWHSALRPQRKRRAPAVLYNNVVAGGGSSRVAG